MDKNIGILHLSDLHASSKTENTIKSLVDLLKNDTKIIQAQHNTDIDFVCISGDLINSGDNADEELKIVENTVIEPLMKELGLGREKFFIVPGNHEVKRSEIVDYIEEGLQFTLSSEENIEKFLSRNDIESIKRIKYFNAFSSQFGGTPILNNQLIQSYSFSVKETSFGVVCINSAWRSTGSGPSEKGKMVIGRKLIIDGFESIKTADIKICLMHHPLDWLVDEDEIAIQKCINQFDIVLNGHIHETSTKIYTSYNGQAIFNTCGKFDKSSDIYNGYSLISINPYNKDCNIILRQYLDYPRNCFDKAIGLQPDGVFTVALENKDDTLSLAYNMTHSISTKFLDYANSYFVSNVATGNVQKNFEESFITPVFSKHSEYEKETSFDESSEENSITLEQICNDKKNFLLLGKKEIGKTTILHYIIRHCVYNFNTLHSVPILIDCSQINFAGKNVISRAIFQYVNGFCSDEDSYSQNDINKLLDAGLCTVLFDNFDCINTKDLFKVNEFLSTFNKNKFVFSETETITARSLRKIPVIPGCTCEEVHICSLTKGQIRYVAKQYMIQNEFEESLSLVDKVMLCFKRTSLPKTPFVLSLILSLCNNSDFSPVNEATVMEQFMESLLEKTSFTEVDSSKFDFRIKEDFLIYIVSFMNKQNRYFLTNDEFSQLLNDYHAYIGFSISETGFEQLFFEKGVLVKNNLNITFRYVCMIEYYIAKKAEQEPEFLDSIMVNRNYLNYSKELIYYTGLYRKNHNVLNIIQADLLSYYDSLRDKITDLKDYNIGLEISFSGDNLQEQLVESRFSQEKSDEISDIGDKSETLLPENIDKQANYGDIDSFLETLVIYGNCIKNLELISKQEKNDAYHIYLTGLCIMLSILRENTEKDFNDIIGNMENLPENFSKEEIEHARNTFNDIIKIALPLCIQNIALENVGTVKLRSILEQSILNSKKDDFQKFFSVFIYADLRLSGLQNVLSKYATEVENKSLLKIIFFKLLYYYQFRYFSSSLDSFLENTLVDIEIKLRNVSKLHKEYLLKGIKSTERSSISFK